ncbi:hypothetical protein B1729_14570 [Microbacterium sp. B35-04]|uniref:hypothetical protein n=1 Tax=Microbacterium sp. B35-04 TaxID=1961716 RepID=UPI0013D617A5|nr:hypothetical protein [Microbacterium sp. B35-04]KAF2412533.1 hypothetical protein B1729_14570 [Microbacterium sp. B35-04]
MDRGDKARTRDYIGQYLDVSGSRLSDYQAQRLVDFIENYDKYRGQSFTKKRSTPGWGSDGRYERTEIIIDTFTDAVGIQRETLHRYDDGQEDRYAENITTARGILDWLDAHR